MAVDLNSSLMFAAVHTGAGTTGLGEATLKSRTDIAYSVLRWLDLVKYTLPRAATELRSFSHIGAESSTDSLVVRRRRRGLGKWLKRTR